MRTSLLVFLAFLAALIAGCGEGGRWGLLVQNNQSGVGGSAPVCAGVCAATEYALFRPPSVWSIGAPGEVSDCADVGLTEGSRVFGQLLAPHGCPECSCAPSGCALAEAIDVSAASCANADVGSSIAWDSRGWEGVCTSQGAVPAGAMCGGVPCVESVTIGATVIEPCHPIATGKEEIPEPSFGQVAQQCLIGPLVGDGCGSDEACVPAPPGFIVCLHRDGDDPKVACPDLYPRRFVMQAATDDSRACEPCDCGPPEGGACSALVEVFTDDACGAILASTTVTSDKPACIDVPAGAALGSKSAKWIEQKSGECLASGGPIGDVVPVAPLTLCCEPESDPVP